MRLVLCFALLVAGTSLGAAEVEPSDRMVYHLFFRSLDARNLAQREAAEAKLGSAGFSADERRAIHRVAREYNSYSRSMERDIERLQSKGNRKLGDVEAKRRIGKYQRERFEFTDEFRSTLPRRLGAAVAAKLDAYLVERVRPSVRSFTLEAE